MVHDIFFLRHRDMKNHISLHMESDAWNLVFADTFDDNVTQEHPSMSWSSSSKQPWKRFKTAGKKNNDEEDDDDKVVEKIVGAIDFSPMYRDPNRTGFKVDKYMVYQLPLKSLAFSYEIQGYRLTSTFFNLPMVQCKSCQVTPLPLTIEILNEMLKECTEVSEMKRETIMERLLLLPGETAAKDWKAKESQKYVFVSSMVDVRHIIRDVHGTIPKTDVMIQYFFHREIQALCRLYEKKYLVTMKAQQLEELYNRLHSAPQELCCSDLYDFRWQIEDPDTGIMNEVPTFKDYVPITELDTNTLERQGYVIDLFSRVWISLYKYVKKRYYEEKHSYTSTWMTDAYVSVLTQDQSVRHSAQQFLLHRRVLVLKEGRYYLFKPFLYELMIARSIGTLYQRYLFRRPVYQDIQEWQQTMMQQKKQWFSNAHPRLFGDLCEEQQRAMFELSLVKPLTLISGPGGSGKTHTLESIIHSVTDSGIFVTAFQHKNVGHLQEMCRDRNIFFTTHQLIMTGAKYCHKNADKRFATTTTTPKQTVDEKTRLSCEKCIFENIEVLVFDEVGLEDLEIFAKLVYHATHCGKLKHVICSGDCFQLPSVRPGNVISDLKRICHGDSRLSSYIEFQHNHRAAYQILFDNANAIKHKRPKEIRFDGKIAIQRAFKNDVDSLIQQLLSEFQLAPESSHVITYTNEMKRKVDQAAETYYLSRIHTKDYEWKPYVFWPGTKVVIKKSDVCSDKINNEILIIRRFYDISPLMPDKQLPVKNTSAYHGHNVFRYMECVTMKGKSKTILLDAETRKVMRKSFATTNYSFIGDQTDTIIYIVPPYNKHETCRTIYTGFTRAKKRLIYVGTSETLESSILEDEPVRQSSLHLYVAKELDMADQRAKERLEKIQEKSNKKIAHMQV